MSYYESDSIKRIERIMEWNFGVHIKPNYDEIVKKIEEILDDLPGPNSDKSDVRQFDLIARQHLVSAIDALNHLNGLNKLDTLFEKLKRHPGFVEFKVVKDNNFTI